MTELASHLSRRRFARSLAAAAVVAALPGGDLIRPASAARTWCRMDPEFRINGKLGRVYLSAPQQINDLVTGPSQVVISVPKHAATEFLTADEGFGKLGYDVRFEEDESLKSKSKSDEVEIQIWVPADAGLTVLAEYVHPQANSGKKFVDHKRSKTNTWIRVKGKL